jgi:hypothetical protein
LRTQIDRYKFQPIISVASLATQDSKTVEIPFAEAIHHRPVQLTIRSPLRPDRDHADAGESDTSQRFRFDDTAYTYRFKYVDNAKPREVVVKTARTLARQLELLAPRHMRGAVIAGLEGDVEPASLAQALKGYRQQSVPQSLPTPLDVQWKIALANGQIITITRPITDTTVVWTAPDHPGQFTIAALVDHSHTARANSASPRISQPPHRLRPLLISRRLQRRRPPSPLDRA